MRSKKLLCIVMVLVAVFIFPFLSPGRAAEVKIAVLLSNSGQPYTETLAGFKQYLEKKDVRADFKVYTLDGDSGKAAQAVSDIKKNRPTLLFCLGGLAAERASSEIADLPIISTMVLRTSEQKKTNATGISLDFSADTHFNWMRRILPKVKTVGVVYNPKENKEKVAAASRAAQKLGLKLEAQEVLAPKDLPAALEKLANSADVLWGIADNTVLTPQTAKLVLLFSFRNHIPFVGPSSSWVKAGALYSLDGDFTDMGAQAGEIAVKVLQGASAGSFQPAPPRKVLYSLNLKTAGEMSLKIPEDIARNAKNTY